MNKRYVVVHENGSDYGVVDLQRNRMSVATGLEQDEADIAASNLNKKDKEEKAQYA